MSPDTRRRYDRTVWRVAREMAEHYGRDLVDEYSRLRFAGALDPVLRVALEDEFEAELGGPRECWL